MADEDADAQSTVACPKCATRYRAPGSVIGGPRATYRCARCGHVFSREATIADTLEEDDDRLVPADLTPGDAPRFLSGRRHDRDADVDLPPEPAFTADLYRKETEDIMADAPSPSWLRAGLRFEVFVLLLFGALGLYLLANPDETTELLGRVSLGWTIETGESPASEITVAGLQGFHERLRNDEPAFVLIGQVVNNSKRPVGAIQVEGRLYNREVETARKAVYAGTKVSRRLVRSWTPAAINMFEKIKPPKYYQLGAGDTDDFLIIFRGVGDPVAEFGARIVSVQPVTAG